MEFAQITKLSQIQSKAITSCTHALPKNYGNWRGEWVFCTYFFLSTESKAALKDTEPVTNVMKNPSKVVVLRVSCEFYLFIVTERFVIAGCLSCRDNSKLARRFCQSPCTVMCTFTWKTKWIQNTNYLSCMCVWWAWFCFAEYGRSWRGRRRFTAWGCRGM